MDYEVYSKNNIDYLIIKVIVSCRLVILQH